MADDHSAIHIYPCPGCGKKLATKLENIGTLAKCRSCGNRHSVPTIKPKPAPAPKPKDEPEPAKDNQAGVLQWIKNIWDAFRAGPAGEPHPPRRATQTSLSDSADARKVRECLESDCQYGEWECEFLESIGSRLKYGRPLTEKQRYELDILYEMMHDPERPRKE